MWTLIIILHVHNGYNVTMKDFQTKEDCLVVEKIIKDHTNNDAGSWFTSYTYSECKETARAYR